jgi:two-component system capsular synthesis response regulator RcsB
METDLDGAGGPRILLADDHPLCAMGVEQTIEADGVGHVVGRVETPEHMIDSLPMLRPDMVVTDYSMPSRRFGDGLQLLRYLKTHHPTLPVVVLTMASNPGVLNSIWAAGVAGLVSKNGPARELPQAIKAVISGRRCAAPTIRELIGLDPWLNAGTRLSPRESEVLRLFSSGLSGNEIANRLRRSKKTVSRQKIDGMRKLGVTNDAEFFVFAKMHEDSFKLRLMEPGRKN